MNYLNRKETSTERRNEANNCFYWTDLLRVGRRAGRRPSGITGRERGHKDHGGKSAQESNGKVGSVYLNHLGENFSCQNSPKRHKKTKMVPEPSNKWNHGFKVLQTNIHKKSPGLSICRVVLPVGK